jgi:hypothetical protein
MINIDVRADLRQVAARFSGEVQAQMRPAIVRALNRTATTTRGQASREIRAVYNIKASAIREQIKLIRARRDNLTALLVASGKRIPLVDFTGQILPSARTRKPVYVRVKRAGGRKIVRHAFIAKMASGHIGVFLRKQPGSPNFAPVYRSGRIRSRGSDLPIAELSTLSLPQAFTNKQVLVALERVARTRFPLEFERELRFRASRL